MKLFARSKIQQRKKARGKPRAYASRSPLVLLLLLLLWSICLGCGLGLAMDIPSHPPTAPYPSLLPIPRNINSFSSSFRVGATQEVEAVSQLPQKVIFASDNSEGTVDPVPQRYQLGQQLYRENCGTCHIALPPPVFPTETWRNLLQDQDHYGERLQPLIGPTTLILWEYLRNFSRYPLQGEKIPYRVSESRYFKALHPRVKLSPNLKITSCVTCHPSAAKFNFRELTPEWENSP